MKQFAALLALAVIASAQSLNSFPTCTTTCYEELLANSCPDNTAACACDHASEIEDCVKSVCSVPDQNVGLSLFSEFCKEAGVTISISSTATSSSAPSTATAAALTTLSSCTQNCVIVTGDCTTVECACAASSAILECVEESCGPDDEDKAVKFLASACRPVFPTSSTSSAPSTSSVTASTSSNIFSSTPAASSTLFITSVPMTTSTVYATQVHTITSCAATVTNCPVGHVTTEIVALYTTVCPVTAAETTKPKPYVYTYANSTLPTTLHSASYKPAESTTTVHPVTKVSTTGTSNPVSTSVVIAGASTAAPFGAFVLFALVGFVGF